MENNVQVQRFAETIILGAIRHHFNTNVVTYEWVTPWVCFFDLTATSEVDVEANGRLYRVFIRRLGETRLQLEHVEPFQSEYSLVWDEEDETTEANWSK